MARVPKSSLIEPLSWEKVDPDYGNRTGYDADFLGRRVSSPVLGSQLKKTATLAPLAYEHFSVLLNPHRKLAIWTAVNIDGANNRRLATRKADAWWVDRREPGTHIPHQVTNTFYKGSGFERGTWSAASTLRGEVRTARLRGAKPILFISRIALRRCRS